MGSRHTWEKSRRGSDKPKDGSSIPAVSGRPVALLTSDSVVESGREVPEMIV